MIPDISTKGLRLGWILTLNFVLFLDRVVYIPSYWSFNSSDKDLLIPLSIFLECYQDSSRYCLAKGQTVPYQPDGFL